MLRGQSIFRFGLTSFSFSINVAIVLTIILILTGCATEDKGLYRHSKTMGGLEVPPDLTRPQKIDTYTVPEIGAELRIKPLTEGASRVKVIRDGAQRWLEIEENTDVLWRRLREYWSDHEVKLAWENRGLGIMETEWVRHYENDFAKDRFRIRLEPGRSNDKITELYLSHQGVQEEFVNGTAVTSWGERPNDSELEIEVLGQILVYLGLPREKAEKAKKEAKKAESKVSMIKGKTPTLLIKGEEKKAIKTLEQAVNRLGHVIVKRIKADGILEIDAEERAEGFKPGFAEVEGQRSKYRLRYQSKDEGVRVVMLDERNEADGSAFAMETLSRLYEHMSK